MDKKTVGSWLVHHTNKLQKVDSQNGFNKIYIAGKSGILLSALAGDADTQLSNGKVSALAEAANINELELPAILQKLKERDLIDQSASGISVLGVTPSTLLERTSDIFYQSQPTAIEIASIEIAEDSSLKPIAFKEISEKISDSHKLSNTQTEIFLSRAEKIGFVDAELLQNNEKLYFNGNLFRRNNSSKINSVLTTLSAAESRSLTDLISELQTKSCISYEEAQLILGPILCAKIMGLGIFDVNVVANQLGSNAFVTLPSAFHKFSSSMVDDAFDLAKAFVSSITYGMTKSTSNRGKITMVRQLLQTLVRGEPVGPAPAIEQDYKVLEMKGVVKVYQGTKNGYFGKRSGWLMELKKKEIGEIALQVIQEGDASEQSLTALPGALITQYRGPEDHRAISRRNQVEVDPAATNNILNALRFGKENG